MPSVKEMILSEEYADLILPVYTGFLEDYKEYGARIFNEYYGIIHYPLAEEFFQNYYDYGFFYNTVPKLFTLLNSVSLDASGITAVQNQPVLNLKGRDVLLGFIDTGISYTHKAFRQKDGSSRIYGIWDQTIQSGTPPYDLQYGSGYTREDIEQALKAQNPFQIVPSQDENGHGTQLAGIAAGSELAEDDFIGAAPEAMIAMVKLKEAKNYLKELFYVTGGTGLPVL
ncbi:MAG: S8 family serine peptidase, partial [Mediterraneibacter gnavus]